MCVFALLILLYDHIIIKPNMQFLQRHVWDVCGKNHSAQTFMQEIPWRTYLYTITSTASHVATGAPSEARAWPIAT